MGIMFVSVKEMHENFWAALSREKKTPYNQKKKKKNHQKNNSNNKKTNPNKNPGWWNF